MRSLPQFREFLSHLSCRILNKWNWRFRQSTTPTCRQSRNSFSPKVSQKWKSIARMRYREHSVAKIKNKTYFVSSATRAEASWRTIPTGRKTIKIISGTKPKEIGISWPNQSLNAVKYNSPLDLRSVRRKSPAIRRHPYPQINRSTTKHK